ncbi:MAG: hypothetical protein U5L04_05340 [Trueperaceae bacterium]|nr:hypothetical protein [Trueperaceae bacterium]MDZ7703892.1 hypothetical protein [Trueperaceae bacterium]
MSTEDTSSPSVETFPENADREEILELVEDALREAHRKVESGRVYDAEAERVRIKWIRTVGYMADQYRKVLRDDDLEQMRAEIDELRDTIDGGGSS